MCPWLGEWREILPQHKYFTVDCVFKQLPTNTQLLRHFVQKWKSAFPPSSSALPGCWMMFKVDSLGETMKEIKVYLLNGLTCRRWKTNKKPGSGYQVITAATVSVDSTVHRGLGWVCPHFSSCNPVNTVISLFWFLPYRERSQGRQSYMQN